MRFAVVIVLASCGSVKDKPSGDIDAASIADGPAADAAVDAVDAPAPRKVVFVTSQAFTGNLGGLTGADAKCQTLAQAASLPGTFRAWLGNANVSAASRLTHATVPYMLVDGSVVATDYAGLTSGTLLHAINITELGTVALGGTATTCFFGGSGRLVWTNASTTGEIVNNNPVNSCGADWNTAGPSTSSGPFGVVGVVGEVNGNWTVLCGSGKCEDTAPLYCLEQ